MTTRTAPSPLPAPPALSGLQPVPYDRVTWEQAVMASHLHSNARLVAFLLAHYADDSGLIEAGGPQDAELLAKRSGVEGRYVRVSLTQLERRHFIKRPSIHGWQDKDVVRPITLIVPLTFRSLPPSTGEPR